MCTNFRETLEEQLKKPEFAAAWEASDSTRREVWIGLLHTGEERARSKGLDGRMMDTYAHGFAVGYIDAREYYAFNALDLEYDIEEIADIVDLPIEWVQALAKANKSKICNLLTLDEFYENPEDHLTRIKKAPRPTLIREPDGSEVVVMGWEQYQNLLCATDVLEDSTNAV